MIKDNEIKEGLDAAYKAAGSNAYFANGFYSGVKFAQRKSKVPELLEAVKGIFSLRNIILPNPLEVKAEHQGEAAAIYQALSTIESLLKSLE